MLVPVLPAVTAFRSASRMKALTSRVPKYVAAGCERPLLAREAREPEPPS